MRSPFVCDLLLFFDNLGTLLAMTIIIQSPTLPVYSRQSEPGLPLVAPNCQDIKH